MRIFRRECGARLHWGKAGWPQYAACFDGAREYPATWCHFGCAVQVRNRLTRHFALLHTGIKEPSCVLLMLCPGTPFTRGMTPILALCYLADKPLRQVPSLNKVRAWGAMQRGLDMIR